VGGNTIIPTDRRSDRAGRLGSLNFEKHPHVHPPAAHIPLCVSRRGEQEIRLLATLSIGIGDDHVDAVVRVIGPAVLDAVVVGFLHAHECGRTTHLRIN
jgi:hypothetical protein